MQETNPTTNVPPVVPSDTTVNVMPTPVAPEPTPIPPLSMPPEMKKPGASKWVYIFLALLLIALLAAVGYMLLLKKTDTTSQVQTTTAPADINATIPPQPNIVIPTDQPTPSATASDSGSPVPTTPSLPGY